MATKVSELLSEIDAWLLKMPEVEQRLRYALRDAIELEHELRFFKNALQHHHCEGGHRVPLRTVREQEAESE